MEMKLIDRAPEGELLLVGRLDATSAPQAEQLILETSEKYETLILNMEELTFVASAGLRVLKNAHLTMKKKGGSLRLKHVQSMVMEVLDMTGFARILNIE